MMAITVLSCSVSLFGQDSTKFGSNPVQADAFFQISYAANLSVADSVFNISNAGGSSTNFCVNVYTFSPDEQLISCCACNVTPNGLVSLSAQQDLISNTLTPAVPGSIVVKLLATTTIGPCNAANPGLAVGIGLAAWGSTVHAGPVAGAYSMTETPFVPALISFPEFGRITTLCNFIQSNGSGYGLCRSCRSGALGAVKQ